MSGDKPFDGTIKADITPARLEQLMRHSGCIIVPCGPDCPRNEPDPEDVHTFDCGCTGDQATGFPISTCKRPDQRSALVKASAALQQLGMSLKLASDEAGGTIGLKLRLGEAAAYAVKAAKALIGAEE